MFRALLIAVLAMSWVPFACAQDIELGGLLINETRTFAGQEFFNAFASLWQAYDPDSVYTLVIQERPSARSGSQISVLFSNNIVFQRFVSFNVRRAHNLGEEAVGTVYSGIQGAVLDQFLGDPDFGAQDIN